MPEPCPRVWAFRQIVIATSDHNNQATTTRHQYFLPLVCTDNQLRRASPTPDLL